jgi:hypothetical protein
MWAELYEDDGASTFTTPTTDFIPIIGSTLITGRAGSNNFLKTDPNNTTSARIVMGKDGKGIYQCNFTVSFAASVGNKTYHIAVFKNGVKQNNISLERKIGAAGDVGAAAGTGHILLNDPNDYVDIRGQAESTGAVISVSHFNLSMNFLTSSTDMGVING